MKSISTKIIKEAVYNLCRNANIALCQESYKKIFNAYENSKNTEAKNILANILQNAYTAYNKKRPLCQDTGQVIVFIEAGQNINLSGQFIEDAVNEAVSDCYRDNYFRKSVVKNAVFERENTKNNTPCVIYTNYIKEDEIRIKVLIKGAGSENKSKLIMLFPTETKEDIVKKTGDLILSAGVNACPPMFIGIGIGLTADKAMVMSKEVFFENEFTPDELSLSEEIKNYVNNNAPEPYKNCYVLDVKTKTAPTHIACMPVGITINCHSERLASCVISAENKITYFGETPEYKLIKENNDNYIEIKTEEIEAIRNLKAGTKVLLTGEIYVARDMAHKRMVEIISRGEELPIPIKDKIIFYAGPCPNKPNEIIGSIGPTTAERMDKYALELYNRGLLATIGKGGRSDEIKKTILKNKAKYFTITGGIAALIAEKVKKSEITAYNDLGTEAIYKLYVEKLPIKTEI